MKTTTIEKMIALGAKRWTKAGKDRLYINRGSEVILRLCMAAGDISFKDLSNADRTRWTMTDGYIDLVSGKAYLMINTSGPNSSAATRVQKALEDEAVLEELLDTVAMPKTETKVFKDKKNMMIEVVTVPAKKADPFKEDFDEADTHMVDFMMDCKTALKY